jgi:hypothetical protein
VNEPSTLIINRQGAEPKSRLTAAQKALLDRKVLPLNSLLHGAYYNGLLDNLTATGRWHAEKRRFVFWEHSVDQPQAKATPHVADLGTGPRFAPLSKQDSNGAAHISDFAFATAR